MRWLMVLIVPLLAACGEGAPRPTPPGVAWLVARQPPPHNQAYRFRPDGDADTYLRWQGEMRPDPACAPTEAQLQVWRRYVALMERALDEQWPDWQFGGDPVKQGAEQLVLGGDACRGPYWEVRTPAEARAMLDYLLSALG